MRKLAPALISLLVLFGAQGVANADELDVSPDRFAPKVHIKVKKPFPGMFREDSTRKTNRLGIETKSVDRDLRCRKRPNGTTQCFGMGYVAPPDMPEKLSLGDILSAVREIGLPSLKIRIQPGGETLVNLDTILYAQPQPFRRSVNLLGFDIDLTASPIRYTWQHGDGTSHATNRPGKPYPSKDVTYRYQKSANDLHPSVDVIYAVRFRIDDGPWQNLSQTLQATGPTGNLDVKEATPVLTGS